MLFRNVIHTGKPPRMHFWKEILSRLYSPCLAKRSRALRGRNSTRDNQVEGRVKNVPLSWRPAPGQLSLAPFERPSHASKNPTAAAPNTLYFYPQILRKTRIYDRKWWGPPGVRSTIGPILDHLFDHVRRKCQKRGTTCAQQPDREVAPLPARKAPCKQPLVETRP